MGVPKRRTSKSKKNIRRSAWRKMDTQEITECPKCHELKESHKVCPACGFYKDKQVLAVKNN